MDLDVALGALRGVGHLVTRPAEGIAVDGAAHLDGVLVAAVDSRVEVELVALEAEEGLALHQEIVGDAPVDAVYSFHAHNFIALYGETGHRLVGPEGNAVLSTENGFVLWQPGTEKEPWEQGALSAVVDDPDTKVNCAWFRGGWFDPLTVLWKTVAEGTTPEAGPVTDEERQWLERIGDYVHPLSPNTTFDFLVPGRGLKKKKK